MVFVVLLKEQIQPAEMIRGLWESPLNSTGKLCPFREGEMHLLWIATFLPGDCTKESDDVVCDIVLNG